MASYDRTGSTALDALASGVDSFTTRATAKVYHFVFSEVPQFGSLRPPQKSDI